MKKTCYIPVLPSGWELADVGGKFVPICPAGHTSKIVGDCVVCDRCGESGRVRFEPITWDLNAGWLDWETISLIFMVVGLFLCGFGFGYMVGIW